jgi:hypothetical protein
VKNMNIKKIIAGTIAGGLVFGSMALPVLAGNAGDGSGWGTQPGYSVASGNTICADHGSFGAFGKGANLGIEYSPGNGHIQHADWLQSAPGPGTDGTQTGINNSTLCGNPQN